MNTLWEAEHRRAAVVRKVVARLDESRNGLPVLTDIPGITDEFPDFGDLLVALQRRWEVALGTRIEMELECGEDELAEDIAEAWRELATDQPGLRRMLDFYAGHPALRSAVATEHQLVAVAAGLASFDTPLSLADEIGEKFLTRVWDPRPPKKAKVKHHAQDYEIHWAARDRARLSPGAVPQIATVPAGPYK